jgi:hypothetical protein
MAAVLALVMLPIIAAAGCFISIIRTDGSLSSAFAGATFFALAAFVLVGALRITHDAEGDDTLPNH